MTNFDIGIFSVLLLPRPQPITFTNLEEVFSGWQSLQAVTVLLFHSSASLCLLASRTHRKENDTAESDNVLFKTSDFAFSCDPQFLLSPLLHLSTYQDGGRKNDKGEV